MTKKLALRRNHLKLAETPATAPANEESKDYFNEAHGLKFAGTHLLIDVWGARNLDDSELVSAMLVRAVKEAKATLLRLDLHKFEPNGGISGVAVLAESHMSIHTWPERGFAAIDMFTCGNAEPHKVIAVIRDMLKPAHLQVSEHRRGLHA
ncbi:MAG: adenosylmethionine decarboxylase [Alphaproteobacteria bacterium]|nr:adenosylmethionine decarboxylase [Alphaproteobacteria bacterium]